MADATELPAPQHISLAYAEPAQREAWRTLFLLDLRLGGLVIHAREPMLAQIRLAWWRDALALPPLMRPSGDPLLKQIGQHLAGVESELSALATAWEALIGDAPLPLERLTEYCTLRAAAYAAMAQLAGAPDSRASAVAHARQWVIGDTQSRLSDPQERATVLALARGSAPTEGLPRAMRPLAVLSALGQRAARLEQPVFEGRSSALLALRVGLLGR